MKDLKDLKDLEAEQAELLASASRLVEQAHWGCVTWEWILDAERVMRHERTCRMEQW